MTIDEMRLRVAKLRQHLDFAAMDRFSDHASYSRGSEERVLAAKTPMEELTELKALAHVSGVAWVDIDPDHRPVKPRRFL